MYLAFFKTILAALFGTFGLPLRFMPSKPSFLHDRFTTKHSDFSNFLAVYTTDTPENRSIHAYAVTYLTVFALRGFIFHDFTKNKEGVRAIRAIKYRKYVPWKENILALAHLWRGSTQIEYFSQKMAQQI